MKETFGWGPALFAIAAMALFGMILFMLAWGANADGYKSSTNGQTVNEGK
jgi:hypothetical protein